MARKPNPLPAERLEQIEKAINKFKEDFQIELSIDEIKDRLNVESEDFCITTLDEVARILFDEKEVSQKERIVLAACFGSQTKVADMFEVTFQNVWSWKKKFIETGRIEMKCYRKDETLIKPTIAAVNRAVDIAFKKGVFDLKQRVEDGRPLEHLKRIVVLEIVYNIRRQADIGEIIGIDQVYVSGLKINNRDEYENFKVTVQKAVKEKRI